MISLISLALFSHVANADGPVVVNTPHLPGPGTVITCDPNFDPNCGKVIVTSPAGGSIEPDPTRTERDCAAYYDVRACMATPDVFGAFDAGTGRTFLFVFTSAQRASFTYTQVMMDVDLGGRLDFDSTLADIDGDGALDLILGVPHDSTVARDAGALYVFYGPTTEGEYRAERPDAVIYGTVAGGELGLSVARMAGDRGVDGLRANGPKEGLIYVIPATGDLPEKLSTDYLQRY